MSSNYRDDRASLLQTLASLQRENEDLRTENLALRVLVEPTHGGRSRAELQGALTAVLVVAAALLGALVVTRDAAISPPATRRAMRELPLISAALPIPAQAPDPPLTPAPSDPAADPPAEPAADTQTAPATLRAALRPLEPSLSRCLRGVRGELRLRVTLDRDGLVSAASVTPRRRTVATPEALRCASAVAGELRLDAEGPAELRYLLRADGDALTVRRARRR